MSKRVQVTLQEDIVADLERLSKEMGITKSAVITLALREYSKKKEEVK